MAIRVPSSVYTSSSGDRQLAALACSREQVLREADEVK